MELFEKYSSIDPLISISAFDLVMRRYYLYNYIYITPSYMYLHYQIYLTNYYI